MSDLAAMELIDGFTRIASQAAATILAMRDRAAGRREKADQSPVTAADEASEAVIVAGLARLLPDVPVISEEMVAAGRRPGAVGPRALLVDPLDGTREWLAGRDEFTVNIALVENGIPAVGVVAAPARGTIWRGAAGHGAERLALTPGAPPAEARECVAIRVRPYPKDHTRVLVSRSHLDPATAAYVDRLTAGELIARGSALKFAMLAEGAADLYPRLGPTSEWDVAAGHALLTAAGGDVLRPDGEPLRYGAADFLIPGFIAFGDRAAMRAV